MRLWHQDLLKHLPKQILLGQHRECCALRGKGWDKKHSTVQYALDDDIEKLIAYHFIVIDELKYNHNVNIDEKWNGCQYRGRKLLQDDNIKLYTDNADGVINYHCRSEFPIYTQHDHQYLIECLDNLWGKMTTKLKRYDGTNYNLKYRSEVCKMFKDYYQWYIDDKIEEYLYYKEV